MWVLLDCRGCVQRLFQAPGSSHALGGGTMSWKHVLQVRSTLYRTGKRSSKPLENDSFLQRLLNPSVQFALINLLFCAFLSLLCFPTSLELMFIKIKHWNQTSLSIQSNQGSNRILALLWLGSTLELVKYHEYFRYLLTNQKSVLLRDTSTLEYTKKATSPANRQEFKTRLAQPLRNSKANRAKWLCSFLLYFFFISCI